MVLANPSVMAPPSQAAKASITAWPLPAPDGGGTIWATPMPFLVTTKLSPALARSMKVAKFRLASVVVMTDRDATPTMKSDYLILAIYGTPNHPRRNVVSRKPVQADNGVQP
jgi:hypothetical protein